MPNDVVTSSGVEDIVDAFSKDDADVKDVKDTKSVKEKDDTKLDDDKSDDDDDTVDINLDEEEDEDDDEIDVDDEGEDSEEDEIDFQAPPRRKEIAEAFPKIFEKFPYLDKMLVRDRRMNEMFGSFDEMKDAHEKSQILDRFENDILSGNTTTILKQVKTRDEKAFNKIVDNYLVTLRDIDKDAFKHVIGNVGKQFVQDMAAYAEENEDEDLGKAAVALNKFLFGSKKWTPPAKLSAQKNNEEDENSEAKKLERERQAFAQQRFETARDETRTKIDNLLKRTIDDAIDPKNVMTSYVKRNAVRDALQQTYALIDADTSFGRKFNMLWREAMNDNFSQSSLRQIQKATLGKAKSVLVVAIKKARAEALKDLNTSSRRNGEDEKEETPRERKNVKPGAPHSQRSQRLVKQKGESDMDFLMRD